MRLALTGILLGTIIFALASSGARGADDNEFAIRSHRQVYSHTFMSARARGLGRTYVALANGSAGVLENPASLGAQINQQALAEFGIDQIESASSSADVIHINVGGSFNINAMAPEYWDRASMGNHTVGLFVNHSGVDFIGQDALRSSLSGVTGAYGRSFNGGRLFGGFAVSYAEGQYQNDNRTINEELKRWELKIGGIYRPQEDLALGGMFSYGRGSINDDGIIDNNGEVRHFEFRVGAAYQISERVLLVSDISREDLDTVRTDDNDQQEHDIWTLSGGVEYQAIPDRVTLRGGAFYTYDDFEAVGASRSAESDVDSVFGVTGGIGYYRDNIHMGYSLDYRQTGEVGNWIRVGIDW